MWSKLLLLMLASVVVFPAPGSSPTPTRLPSPTPILTVTPVPTVTPNQPLVPTVVPTVPFIPVTPTPNSGGGDVIPPPAGGGAGAGGQPYDTLAPALDEGTVFLPRLFFDGSDWVSVQPAGSPFWMPDLNSIEYQDSNEFPLLLLAVGLLSLVLQCTFPLVAVLPLLYLWAGYNCVWWAYALVLPAGLLRYVLRLTRVFTSRLS